MKFATYLLGVLSGMVVVVPMIAYFIFANGFVLSRIWLWHVVPLGFDPIRWQFFAVLPSAVATIVGNRKLPDLKKSTGSDAWAQTLGLMLAPWLTLLLAWLLK